VIVDFVQVWLRVSWDETEFVQWTPYLLGDIIGGVKVVNNKSEAIEDCKCELVNFIPALPTGQPLPVAEATRDLWPLTLCWIKDGKMKCEPMEIPPHTEAFIGLVYLENVNGEHWYATKGANDVTHIGIPTHVSYTELRFSGKVNGNRLADAYYLVSTVLEGKRVKSMEVAKVQKTKKQPKEKPLTKEGFFKILKKISRPKDAKSSEEKSKTSE
jgi:hypothetical protein